MDKYLHVFSSIECIFSTALGNYIDWLLDDARHTCTNLTTMTCTECFIITFLTVTSYLKGTNTHPYGHMGKRFAN